MKTFLLLAMAPLLSAQILYVGSYTDQGSTSKGISAWRFDAATGKLTSLGAVAETAAPSFVAIHPNGRYLYAVNELEKLNGKPGGGVSAFSIDRTSGKLTFLNQVGSMGGWPCHITIDSTGKVAFVANYATGSFASFPILADGKLGEAATTIQDAGTGPDKERQEGPHAHDMVIAGQLVLGADLGNDHVQVFRMDPAKATLTAANPPFVAMKPGFGPRHMAISKDRKFLYVLSELTAHVAVLEYDPVKGPGKEIASVPALPKDFKGVISGAEIMFDSKGTTLYSSNRGDSNTIAVFSVDPKTGMIKLIANTPSGGKTPRYFTLDPSGKFLLACNQDSNNITVFKVDAATGTLTPTGEAVNTGKPVSIAFLK